VVMCIVNEGRHTDIEEIEVLDRREADDEMSQTQIIRLDGWRYPVPPLNDVIKGPEDSPSGVQKSSSRKIFEATDQARRRKRQYSMLSGGGSNKASKCESQS
jgi:hypothetical protein